MRIRATAPAKLVLIGEYAVLEGAPALVAAVDREVRVTLEPSPDRAWHVRTDLGGGQEAALDPRADLGRLPPWQRPVASVLQRLVRSTGTDVAAIPPQRIELESAALHVDAGEVKLGLGSSAAVIAALGAALRTLLAADAAPHAARLSEDLEAHHAMQAQPGSGVDVAASHFGGVLVYRYVEGRPEVESIALPRDLVVGVVWTGTAASTPDLVGRVRAWQGRDPPGYAARIAAMTRLAEAAVAAWRADDAERFLGLVRAYGAAMGELGRAAGVDILSHAHAEIGRLTEGSEVAYKPSGAGGGDVGLLFARSRRALVQAGRMAERAGYRLLSLDIQPAGVTVRSEEISSP